MRQSPFHLRAPTWSKLLSLSDCVHIVFFQKQLSAREFTSHYAHFVSPKQLLAFEFVGFCASFSPDQLSAFERVGLCAFRFPKNSFFCI